MLQCCLSAMYFSSPVLCSLLIVPLRMHYYFAVNSEDSMFVIFIIIAFVQCLLCALLKLWYGFKSQMCKAASCSGMNKKMYKKEYITLWVYFNGFYLKKCFIFKSGTIQTFYNQSIHCFFATCTPCDKVAKCPYQLQTLCNYMLFFINNMRHVFIVCSTINVFSSFMLPQAILLFKSILVCFFC